MSGPRDMWVAVLRLEIHVPGARSRKDRRQVVKSLKERLRGKFGIACNEVGDLDTWTRATLGVSAIGGSEREAAQFADEIVRYAQNDPEGVLAHVDRDIFRYDGPDGEDDDEGYEDTDEPDEEAADSGEPR